MFKTTTAALFTGLVFTALGVDAATFVPDMGGTSAQQSASLKGDRLQTQPSGPACSKAPWPYYEADCLRGLPRQAGQPNVIRVISIERPAAKSR